MGQSRKKRKRDRLRAGGDRPTFEVAGGQGETPPSPSALSASWQLNVAESAALVRQAIAEDWPTEFGSEILFQLLGGPEELEAADVVRVGRLLLEVERKNRQAER